MRPAAHERGVALLSVLLLVAVMAVLAVAILDDVRFGLRRNANARSGAQAQWYALGAESLARSQIVRLTALEPNRTTLAGGWNGRPFVFPVEGGSISGRINDATHCFNLNSVVNGVPELWIPLEPEEGGYQYEALLRVLGFPDAQARQLSDTLIDWIDTDSAPRLAGGEDPAYAGLPGRPLTASALLSEPSELRALLGYTPEVYRRIRPYVCALPTNQLSPINVNTLAESDAPLLVMLSDGAISLPAARDVIATRPAEGWLESARFWSHPALAASPPPPTALTQIAFRTQFFALLTEVRHLDAEVAMSALIELDLAGRATVVARRWTPEE